MTFTFSKRAKDELKKIVRHYESQRHGLGNEFVKELRRTLEFACQFPDGGTKVSQRLRRWKLHRFPFAILYRHNKIQVTVAVVMDLRRKPDYWRRHR